MPAQVTLIDASPTDAPNESEYTVSINYGDDAMPSETQVYRWTCADAASLKAKLAALAAHYDAQAKAREATPGAVEARGAEARKFERDLIDQTITAK